MRLPAEWSGWEMVEPRTPLRATTRRIASLADDDVLVEVAGCGICHTDLGYLDDGVRTRQPLPLILGHEVSGFVRAAGPAFDHLVGRAVVVPAVIPCGSCDACRAGRPMICPNQVMPGNDRDGGFASHVVVPGRGLCVVPAAPDHPDAALPGGTGLTLRHLAVIADAVSTPYQAVLRSGLGAGDLAVVIGLGGVGGYAAQLAAARGATVVGIDVDPEKLAGAEALGVSLALDARSLGGAARKRVHAFARERGLPDTRWAIFECSGSAPGQETAWSLLVHGATLAVVGFTLAKVEVRLSNLMAFDARAIGNWGCDPAHYPAIVDLALAGGIDLLGHTEIRPLASVAEALDDVRTHRVGKRVVLAPDR